jgi:NADH-quinone oxidoreductase subunit M
LVGVIYDRAHHREIEGFGGLARSPVTGVTALAFFASISSRLSVSFPSVGLARHLAKYPVLTILAPAV